MKHIPLNGSLAPMHANRATLSCSFFALAASSALLGCNVEVASEDAVDSSESAIIGGNAISVATRRSVGLVEVNGGCSGSLITPHWALTATHCVDRAFASNNVVRMARTDGGTDSRSAIALSQVGQTDMTLLQLVPATPGMTWPTTPTRTMVPNALTVLGQNVTCYGQGATAYASPSGLANAGLWRSLVRSVADFDGLNLFVLANNGNNILAPGDSGGPCFFGSQIAGVASHSNNVECADPTNSDTCKATITRINNAALTSTSFYANYINMAPARTATATFRPLELNPNWRVGPNVNIPGVVLVDGTVHLRGGMTTTAEDSLLFTLPAAFRPLNHVYVPINLCGGFKGRLLIQPSGETRVHSESGWGNAQCLTSLEGASFTISNIGFINLTLQNGWGHAPFATRNAAVRISNGIVQLRGAIGGGTTPTVFTLPQAFRPPTNVFSNVDMCGTTKGRLNITTTGQVTVQAEGNFVNAQCFTSLEGVSFPIAATSWTSMAPLNGWTGAPFDTRNPAARNFGGIVRLQGAVATTGTNTHAFTLPAQMRPATVVHLPMDLCFAKNGSLVIQEDGRAFVQSAQPWWTVSCFASLEGLAFGL